MHGCIADPWGMTKLLVLAIAMTAVGCATTGGDTRGAFITAEKDFWANVGDDGPPRPASMAPAPATVNLAYCRANPIGAEAKPVCYPALILPNPNKPAPAATPQPSPSPTRRF
jgi:hypothetical protein